MITFNQFLKWLNWYNHCKDHQLDDVSRSTSTSMMSEYDCLDKNVLTVDGRCTVLLIFVVSKFLLFGILCLFLAVQQIFKWTVLAADRRSRGKRPGNARNRSAIYRNSKTIC